MRKGKDPEPDPYLWLVDLDPGPNTDIIKYLFSQERIKGMRTEGIAL